MSSGDEFNLDQIEDDANSTYEGDNTVYFDDVNVDDLTLLTRNNWF